MKTKYFLSFFILFSCSDQNNIESVLGEEFSLMSSEPFLYSSEDDLFISWTEHEFDTNYLYNAKLINNRWDNKELIAKNIKKAIPNAEN